MSTIFFLMSIDSMSHVGFKKCPRHPVDFKGQEPLGHPGYCGLTFDDVGVEGVLGTGRRVVTSQATRVGLIVCEQYVGTATAGA